MGLTRWLTKNWANTREPTHPDLGPLTLPGSPAAAVRRVEQADAREAKFRITTHRSLLTH